MIKTCIHFAAWMIVIFAVTLGTGLAGENGKSQELSRALADIRSAEQMINQRTALAEEVRQRLRQQVDGLKAEIQLERRRTSVAAFPQARQIRRIDFNLRLVQQLLGYMDCLDNRIGCFRAAVLALEFHRQQIRDDMLMLRTLNDADTASLMRQLAADIEHFKKQVDRPLVMASSSGLRPLDTIWTEVVQGK